MKKAKGFTVIEVLLAVVIMAILAAVLLPRLNKADLYGKYLVYTTAHQIAADARLARRLAVTTGDRHRIRCYEDGGYDRYKIERDSGAWQDAGAQKTIPEDITVKGDSEVIFEPLGSATHNRTFQYEIGDHKYEIDVKKETGRVTLGAY
ncbi:MAG: prepilin-type N-terminal cleavage/methylation domain-containing protein [Candidatus Omnitrophica bacterium]|nr:prepilin-type N-terminal cleavage/methylation domain-containing protein [Candidatus Omnitrophota bacterium]MBU1128384.1 prepilin-type N-terminal cleavage/methylation domain-containing protein [Candidatus Omnitrophota bacterium]MBU1656877.1 prepilin-type N-terminal cleavage/methylation domain-containing protein [Candidatus Omnitrophota bacterium]MBU1784882.1 prepilin-type N-terminal cleavage/methylation domain-containing protein [Candidatus Omnitrophota bacterium]MBU1850870.1 prepilin-type N-